LKLEGMVADSRGQRIIRGSAEGSVTSPQELGVALAQDLLGRGAAEFITEVRGR
jgi:porphobilinogen deaminase